jgi:hypothetical protein
MKLVCIDTCNTKSLTLGKVYEVVDIMPIPHGDYFEYAITVKDDIDTYTRFYGRRFVTLEKWREERLDVILK